MSVAGRSARVRPVALQALVVVGVLAAVAGPARAQDVRSGVEQLAEQIVRGAPAGRQLRIAVADFPDLQGTTTDLGRYVASRLTTRLAQNRQFQVVERQRLNQVIAELKLSMSDLVDPTKARKLGQMVGVEAIVVGTISDVGNQVDIDARMIDIEANRLLLGATVTIGKDPAVTEMLQRGRQEAGTADRPAPASGGVAVSRGDQRAPGYRSDKVSFEVRGVEATGNVLKVMFVYTNLMEKRVRGRIGNESYIVDDRGKRYGFKGSILGNSERQFPPQTPELLWVAFERPGSDASSLTLGLKWYLSTHGWGDVFVRGITLPR